LFRRVTGALHLLSEQDAADVLDGTAELVRVRFLDKRRAPVREELELLAQTVSAIEFYMDGMTGGQSYAVDLIGDARRALAELSEFRSEHLDIVETGEAPKEEIAASPVPEEVADEEEIRETFEEKAIEEELVEVPSPSPPSPVQQDHAPASEPPVSPEPTPVVEEEDVDEEFLEIFLEEAREEQEVVREQFVLWRQDESNSDALNILRRSFHTLKGSGRLVGAERVGDFAWAFENLLNKVLDDSIKVSPELIACVGEAADSLPGLIDAEEARRFVDVTDFIERANRLASGEQLPLAPISAESEVPEELAAAGKVIPLPTKDRGIPIAEGKLPESLQPESVPTLPVEEAAREAELAALADMDEDLLDLFQGEAKEHIRVLEGYLERAAGGDAVPDEPVVRSLHTLTGTARMTGIDSVAAVTSVLESLFRDYRRSGAEASSGALDLLARAAENLNLRVSRLPGGEGEIIALLGLASEAKQLASDIEAGVPEQAAEAIAGLDEIGAELLEEIEREDLAASQADEGQVREVVEKSPELREEDRDVFEVEEVELSEPSAEEATAVFEGEVEAGSVPEPEVSELPQVPVVAEPEPPSEEIAAVAQPDAATAEAELEALPDDWELLGLFLEDARDLLDKLDQGFRELQLDPTAIPPQEELKRLLHTFKGSARLSGLMSIGDLCHAFESLLTGVVQGDARIGDDALELAQRTLDTLADQVDSVEQRKPVRRADALISGLMQALETGAESTADIAVMVRPEPAAPTLEPSVETGPTATEEKPAAAASPEPAVQIRVRADLLNRLIDNAGEISIYGSRLVQQNNVLGFRLEDLDQTVRRLREQLRKLDIETEAQIVHRYERETDASIEAGREDFDPLELDRFSTMQQLSRSLAETVNDLVSIRTILSDLQSESETLLVQQDRVSNALQNGLLRTRMIPFAQIVPRLHRVVRQTAQQLRKQATLEVLGAEVELDRSIQERIVAPLEHLLRNAIAHGIEAPERRVSVSKGPAGVIRLSIRREGNDAVIAVADDGAGLNIPAVRAKAEERGLIQPDAVVSDDEISQLIMASGFSTAKEVSQIAGRGVGMDVVNTEIKQLSGNISLKSETGKGTNFTIRLPLTLAIVEAMLVQVGEEVYAIPHTTMEAAARISREDLQRNFAGTRKDFQYGGHDCRVTYLCSMFEAGATPVIGERAWQPVLLARAGDQRFAFHIDALLGSERVVVKPLGPALSAIRWLTGGTILPDGRVAMILDLLALIRFGLAHAKDAPGQVVAVEEPEAAEAVRRTCVMVVDDSLTVRRVTSRMLKRQDMDVVTARDGVDALTQLEDQIPDLMLLDIEMPRMDGYELTRHIRRSQRLKGIPIIMITSRTGEKHRKFAMDVGVDRYLGKPYQEAELLDEISSVLLESSS